MSKTGSSAPSHCSFACESFNRSSVIGKATSNMILLTISFSCSHLSGAATKMTWQSSVTKVLRSLKGGFTLCHQINFIFTWTRGFLIVHLLTPRGELHSDSIATPSTGTVGNGIAGTHGSSRGKPGVTALSGAGLLQEACTGPGFRHVHSSPNSTLASHTQPPVWVRDFTDHVISALAWTSLTLQGHIHA